MKKRLFALWFCLACCFASAADSNVSSSSRFFFGSRPSEPGVIRLKPSARYSPESGFGFDGGTTSTLRFQPGGTAADGPFFFSARVPEGNYTVTVTLGGSYGAGETTVKAEQRRLMLESVKTGSGEFAARTFTVNVRRPQIAGGGEVRMRDPANPGLNWDDKLTLEFNGPRPCLSAIQIEPAKDVPVIYLVGDSTVVDAAAEPYNSWGQMLTRFLKPGVAVANYAESGRSLKSFIAERRWAKVVSVIKAGDYLFIQMGHNDQKDKAPTVMEDYARNLRMMIGEAKKRGAQAVLVTSVNRRTFEKDGTIRNSLQAFTDSMHEVAKSEGVALIDLNAMSKVFYETLGVEGSGVAFVKGDGTHHNNYGSYEFAKCIAQGIREQKLPLAQYLADDFKGFDPAHPDPAAAFAVPASPRFQNPKSTAGAPTLYLIGDSTVKNGSGKGEGGLWGWGDYMAPLFDPAKIKVENRALGGRSSRTYLAEGLWAKVEADLQPGDFVIMQFGHNDGGELFKGSRPRASLKGSGDQTQEGVVEQTGKPETVHSYGWYLCKYCADAKKKGAMPIVCSQIPRNMWKDGKVLRAAGDYGKWAAEAAKQAGAPFIDLNAIIADHYDRLGEDKIRAFFPGDHTHTNLEGARLNAQCVAEGIKQLKDFPLGNYLKKQ